MITLTKKRMSDPSLLDPKIRALQKKLVKALKTLRSKSLDSLLLYMHLSDYERTVLINNFDILIKEAEKEIRKERDKYFGWAIFFAYLHNKQFQKIAFPPIPTEEEPKEMPTRMPRIPQDMQEIFDRRFDSLMGDVREELLLNIRNTLDQARLKPLGTNELKKKLDDHFNHAEMRGKMIVETEMMYAYNTFLISEMRADGTMWVQWITANDELVCSECGKKHKKVFDIDSIPDIPAHPRCRCIVIPYVK